MDSELKCDFYIGDHVQYSIKLMDYSILKGFKRSLRNIPIVGNFYWQEGAFSLTFHSYKHYIITGEPHCLSTWLILFVNMLIGKKTYLWTHGWYGNEGGLKRVIKRIFFGLSHKVLLYGDYARDLMIQHGFKAEKLITIYNSLDHGSQLKIREKLKITRIYKEHFQNDFPVLLYVGRIQNRKKIELLIDALLKHHKDKTFYNLILIGNKAEDTKIAELVSFYNLEKYVWFFGPCYDENILGELIFNADVCVVPGDVGLTVMHSFVYGTPVITHDNFPKHGPEFEAIEPTVTGDFFKDGSLVDLCLKIETWTAVDVVQREHIRTSCYKVIDEKYNAANQIILLKDLFNLQ